MSRYFLDNAYYFITVPTYQRGQIFNTPEKKRILLERVREGTIKFSLRETDYSILANHYHLIGYFQKGRIIPKFLQYLNGGAAYDVHKRFGSPAVNTPTWDEYHVYCVTDDAVLAKIRGYVVGNPLKHGDVSSFAELSQYPFSSYAQLVTQFGEPTVQEWVRSVIATEENDLINSITKQPD